MKSSNAKTVLILTFVFTFSLLTIPLVQAAPGDLDPSFGDGGRVLSTDFGGNAIAVQSDGKIVAVGMFFSPGSAFQFSLTRYKTDGSLDATFGSGGRVVTNIGSMGAGYATSVAIQPDGKIIAGGSNDVYGDFSVNFLLARYNTDGSLDTTFGLDGRVVTSFNHEAGLRSIAIQPDGKIVAVGNSGGSYEVSNFLLARYNSNGSLDASFGTGGIVANAFANSAYSTAAAIQSDGKIVAVGTNGRAFALARYNADGALDTSFGSGGKVLTMFDGGTVAEDVQIQTDGKILAVGRSYATGYYFALARYNANGSLDSTFGAGGKVMTTFNNGVGHAEAAAIQSDGKIVAVGTSGNGTDGGFTAVRYKTDGSLDPTFGLGGIVVTQFAGTSNGANAVVVRPDGKIVVAGTVYGSAGAFGRFAMIRYQGATPLTVNNVEELYSAVNNPQNAGSQISVAPGTYMLSVNNPKGIARPNGGRLELQQNMSVQGVVGDRSAVVIDAMNLPVSSYNAPPISLTAAIRMGRGTNAVEWLTVRNAVNGNANIGADLASTLTNIRVAHVASSNSVRGLDVRNFGAAHAGRVLNAEIIDNDLFNNRITAGECIRIANNQVAAGATINVTLTGNRSYDNYHGFLVNNNQSSNSFVTVISSGNRFYENAVGGVIIGAVSAGANVGNGNTVTFTADGDVYENNNAVNNSGFPDVGGLVILGGENTSFANGVSNNTVNVALKRCRFVNNQVHDLAAFGARSTPASIGTPGTGNTVFLYLRGLTPKFRTQEFVDCLPASPGSMNTVVLTGLG